MHVHNVSELKLLESCPAQLVYVDLCLQLVMRYFTCFEGRVAAKKLQLQPSIEVPVFDQTLIDIYGILKGCSSHGLKISALWSSGGMASWVISSSCPSGLALRGKWQPQPSRFQFVPHFY